MSMLDTKIGDPDKASVYSGEHRLRALLDFANRKEATPLIEIMGQKLVMPSEMKFGELSAIQKYCDHVCDRVDYPKVMVIRTRKRVNACYYCGRIEIPTVAQGGPSWAMREVVVLHELAHHMNAGWGLESHGLEFRKHFLYLLNRFMSPEVGLALQMLWYNEGL